MVDPPLTSLPLVGPSFSSTPVATSVCESTLLASSLPLAQCTGLEIGETSRGDGSVLEDASRLTSKELALVVPHLQEAPFVEFDGDLALNNDTPSIEHLDPICSELFDSTPTSSPLLSTTPLICMHFMSP